MARETVLVGRDAVVERGVQAVVSHGVRLVSFTGRRGVGTSRVARAVAQRLAGPLVEVSVDDVVDGADLVARVGRVLGLETADGPAILARLDEQPMVIVLDGCRDGVLARPLVEQLLANVEQLTMVVTATSPLGLPDEQAIDLDTLTLPPPDETDAVVVAASPAVALFLERADLVSPTFRASDENVDLVAELCRRLDGLPEAIVVAASRVGLMEPAAMLREMERVGAWQLVGLSMDQEISRSVDLLDEPTKRVLLALATMQAGASVEAAAAVASVSVSEAFEALRVLRELHLASVDAARARFALTSSATEFVERTHADDPAWQERRSLHARHFAEATKAFERLGPSATPDQAGPWVADHQNRLRALAWMRSYGCHDDALRLAVGSMEGFTRRGEPDAGRDLLRAVLDEAAETTSGACIRAHLWLGRLEAESDETVSSIAARDQLETARRLARDRGDLLLLLEVLNAICENHTLIDAGMALVAEAVEEALPLCADPGLEFGRAIFLAWQSLVLHSVPDLPAAADTIAEAMDLARGLGSQRLLVGFGIIHWGLPAAARRRDIGAPSLHQMIDMTVAQGDLRSQGWVLTILAHTALDAGDEAGAIAACVDLLQLARRSGQTPLGRQGLAATIRIVVHHDDHDLAATLEGSFDRHARTVTASIPTHMVVSLEHAVGRARSELGDEAFEAARRRGVGLTLSEAMHLAEQTLATLASAAVPAGLTGTEDAGRADLESEAELGPIGRLTPRERDVLVSLVDGLANKEIAMALGMRPKTVMHHCAEIYRKLEVRNRTEAAAVAVRAGLTSG